MKECKLVDGATFYNCFPLENGDRACSGPARQFPDNKVWACWVYCKATYTSTPLPADNWAKESVVYQLTSVLYDHRGKFDYPKGAKNVIPQGDRPEVEALVKDIAIYAKEVKKKLLFWPT